MINTTVLLYYLHDKHVYSVKVLYTRSNRLIWGNCEQIFPGWEYYLAEIDAHVIYRLHEINRTMMQMMFPMRITNAMTMGIHWFVVDDVELRGRTEDSLNEWASTTTSPHCILYIHCRLQPSPFLFQNMRDNTCISLQMSMRCLIFNHGVQFVQNMVSYVVSCLYWISNLDCRYSFYYKEKININSSSVMFIQVFQKCKICFYKIPTDIGF